MNPTKKQKQYTVNLVTLGCSKNTVDSEHLAAAIAQLGYSVQHNSTDNTAGIVIINTCGFINDAKEESINTIFDYVNLRQQNQLHTLIVTGCLVQRYRNQLTTQIPEVDYFINLQDIEKIIEILAQNAPAAPSARTTNAPTTCNQAQPLRILSTPSHYAYLKISEGCNRKCSYCAIPNIRGKHLSQPIERLVAEAQALADSGVQELILIAQDLTYYGMDLYHHRNLSLLLRKLADISSLKWIRLHYAHPANFPLNILPVMKDYPNICHYLDIPLQHCNDKILASMKRQHTQEQVLRLLDKIRNTLPDITLRTSLIVGYPGETKAIFQELLQFVEQQRFQRLGVFTFSKEENTPAALLPDRIPQHEKQDRQARLMAIQQDIAEQQNQAKVGTTLPVIIDRREGHYYIGRTQGDSPEIDNEVLITTTKKVRPGQIHPATITSAEPFDLYATI